jgi:hypothetical protein
VPPTGSPAVFKGVVERGELFRYGWFESTAPVDSDVLTPRSSATVHPLFSGWGSEVRLQQTPPPWLSALVAANGLRQLRQSEREYTPAPRQIQRYPQMLTGDNVVTGTSPGPHNPGEQLFSIPACAIICLVGKSV